MTARDSDGVFGCDPELSATGRSAQSVLCPNRLPTLAEADACALGVAPASRLHILFQGAEILDEYRAAWGGLRARVATMRRDRVVRNELQTDHHTLFVGVSGDMHHATVRMDGVPFWNGAKGPGKSAFCPAGRHVIGQHDKGSNTTLVLSFGDATVQDLTHQARTPNWQSQPGADDAFINAGSAELARALMSPSDDLTLLWTEAVAANLAIYSVRRFSDLAASRTETGDAIGRALSLIHDLLPAAASLEQLSKASGLPPARLLSGFKARTGSTPHQYIIRERLSRARQLLASTDLSVASVSQMVGCTNAEHLGRMFRQHVGLSPQAWRRIHGGS